MPDAPAHRAADTTPSVSSSRAPHRHPRSPPDADDRLEVSRASAPSASSDEPTSPTLSPEDADEAPPSSQREHFRRGLGAYPLRSRSPA
eukprot:3058346-Pleurochrysis_carterae.AAC.1